MKPELQRERKYSGNKEKLARAAWLFLHPRICFILCGWVLKCDHINPLHLLTESSRTRDKHLP